MPKTQKQQLLREPSIEPTDEVIAEALGAAYSLKTVPCPVATMPLQ